MTDNCEIVKQLPEVQTVLGAATPLQFCHNDTRHAAAVQDVRLVHAAVCGARQRQLPEPARPRPCRRASSTRARRWRRRSAARSAPGPNGQKTVNVYDPNTVFSDRLNQLDIRFSKIFQDRQGHVRRQLRHLQFVQLGRSAGPEHHLFGRERRHVAAADVGHPGPDHQVRLQVGLLAVHEIGARRRHPGRRALLMRHLAFALLAALLRPLPPRRSRTRSFRSRFRFRTRS